MIEPVTNSNPTLTAMSTESLLSPSLQRGVGSSHEAFEIKFLVSEAVALSIEAWALRQLDVDPFADRERGNSYQTTTVYLDTQAFDVMNQMPGFCGRKFRLRRYGSEEMISLERKVRRKDRVKKLRARVSSDDVVRLAQAEAVVDWPGDWFHARVLRKALHPVCCLTYDRTAFMKSTVDGTLRLTLDRRIRGASASDWVPRPVADGPMILRDQVICEMKFRDAMPGLFKQLVADMQLAPASVSKYRGMMAALGHTVRPQS